MTESLQVLAIAKVIKDAMAKEISGSLKAGTYPVDFTVNIHGQVTKGKAYNQNIVAKANPWGLLAVALSKLNGVTVESIIRDAEVIAEGDISQIKEQAELAITKVKANTTQACTGKVTTNLVYKIV